jgi:hypothetical protein
VLPITTGIRNEISNSRLHQIKFLHPILCKRIVHAPINQRHVRSAYQPPVSSTFLSEQTSHQQSAVLFSQNKSAPAISHQPSEQNLKLSENTEFDK